MTEQEEEAAAALHKKSPKTKIYIYKMKENLSPLCAILSSSLVIAPATPLPFPSLCVSHQRGFLWQTSSPCRLFDSQCQLLSATVCRLFITRATDVHKGSSPVACPSCLTAN